MPHQLDRRDFLTRASSFVALATLGVPAINAAAGAAVAGTKRQLKKAIMWDTLGMKGSVMERLKAVKEAGFEGVEMISHMNHEEVLRAQEATGLQIPSVCGSHHWGKPLSDADPKVREQGLEALQQTLRDAKRYGASSVLLVPGKVTKSVSYGECWKRSIEEIRKAIPLAEELEVKIAIENVWNDFITKPEQAVAYLEAINSPQVGWHFDCGNCIRFSPPETWIPVLGKHILKLHIKEYSKAKGFAVQFFQGDNNWPAIMRAIDGVGYRGWGISEQPGDQTRNAERLKDFVARMDRIFSS
jgi:hexulose-6-phosphate isomerase